MPHPIWCIAADDGVQRLCLVETSGADGRETGWDDCHLRALTGGILVAAMPADAQIRAERSLRDFLQTFSQLPVGLAAFNRKSRLVLFNPALTELAQLPVDVLMGRPTLHGFLDALRARGHIAKPDLAGRAPLPGQSPGSRDLTGTAADARRPRDRGDLHPAARRCRDGAMARFVERAAPGPARLVLHDDVDRPAAGRKA